MKNILFSDVNKSSSHKAVVLPSVYATLRSYYEKNGKNYYMYNWLFPIYSEYYFPNEKIDVLALSCYIWNIERQLEFAEKIKQTNTTVFIIVGGPQIPKNKNFLDEHPYIDAMCIQDGEISFTELLDRIAVDNYNIHDINGVITKKTKFINLPNKNKDIESMSLSVKKDLELMIKESRANFKNINLIIETDRGCPFGCTYCDWGSNTQSKIRKFNLSTFVDTLEWASLNKVEMILIANANFGIFERDLEIAKIIANYKEKFGFPKKVHITGYTKTSSKYVLEIIEIFKKNNLENHFKLSIQSFNETALSMIKRKNLSFTHYDKIINKCIEIDQEIRIEMIFGLPGETLETFYAGFDYLNQKNLLNNIIIYPLQLLINSPIMNDIDTYSIKFKKIKFLYDFTGEKTAAKYEDIVIETNSFDKNDYKEMLIFSIILDSIVTKDIIKYPLIWITKNFEINFSDLLLDFIKILKNNHHFSKVFHALENKINLVLDKNSKDDEMFIYHDELKKYLNFNQWISYELILNVDILYNLFRDFVVKFSSSDEINQIILFNYLINIISNEDLSHKFDYNLISWKNNLDKCIYNNPTSGKQTITFLDKKSQSIHNLLRTSFFKFYKCKLL